MNVCACITLYHFVPFNFSFRFPYDAVHHLFHRPAAHPSLPLHLYSGSFTRFPPLSLPPPLRCAQLPVHVFTWSSVGLCFWVGHSEARIEMTQELRCP